MREILFRGKRLNNGEWVIGSLVKMGPVGYVHHFILPDYASAFYDIEVDPSTIGQYTGLTDKNGVKIFEGDICRCIGGEFFQGYHEIDETIVVKDITDGVCVYLGEVESIEVIGNIHDNPELLETEL